MKGNKSSGIYIIRNTIDERFYIGSAKCFHIRHGDHRRESSKNRHHCKPLQNFINKYGFDKLYFEILEVCSIDRLIKREQYYLDTMKPIFNVCKTAGSVLGRKHSDETRKKIRLGNIGKKHDPEVLAKLSDTIAKIHKDPNSKYNNPEYIKQRNKKAALIGNYEDKGKGRRGKKDSELTLNKKRQAQSNRSAESRKRQTEGIRLASGKMKKHHADPNSKYNTLEYQALKKAQLNTPEANAKKGVRAWESRLKKKKLISEIVSSLFQNKCA